MGDNKSEEGAGRRHSSTEDDRNNRSSVSPAHWQGEPLPNGKKGQTQDIGFDQRDKGRSQQYGRAGDFGKTHEKRESRPQRGGRQPDDELREHVQEVFRHSGLNVSEVVVRVREGIVQLEGHIDERGDGYVLERLAVNCHGTVRVENHLGMKGGPDRR